MSHDKEKWEWANCVEFCEEALAKAKTQEKVLNEVYCQIEAEERTVRQLRKALNQNAMHRRMRDAQGQVQRLLGALEHAGTRTDDKDTIQRFCREVYEAERHSEKPASCSYVAPPASDKNYRCGVCGLVLSDAEAAMADGRLKRLRDMAVVSSLAPKES